jgi:hypothetical protein
LFRNLLAGRHWRQPDSDIAKGHAREGIQQDLLDDQLALGHPQCPHRTGDVFIARCRGLKGQWAQAFLDTAGGKEEKVAMAGAWWLKVVWNEDPGTAEDSIIPKGSEAPKAG